MERLLALLSPNAEIHVDDYAARLGAEEGALGAATVADRFVRRGKGLRLVLVDGRAALAAYSEGELRIVFFFAIEQRTIIEVDMVADPARLSTLEVVVADGGS